jgi:hypothetical protein
MENQEQPYPISSLLQSDHSLCLPFNVTESLAWNIQYWCANHPDKLQYLGQPANLESVILPTKIGTDHARLLDMRNLSVIEVINKIIICYTHKLYRRGIGNRVIFRGFIWDEAIYQANISSV